MYQVMLKGCFETENPDKLIEDIKKIAKESNSDVIGDFIVYTLAPYVDYQKCDVKDPETDSTTV